MPILKFNLAIVSSFIFCFIYSTVYGQTIGLLDYDIEATDGYTLFTPEKNTKAFLINNCGELINQWTFNERPGLTCYLLENGNLLRSGKNYLETRDWDNNLIWSYDMQSAGYNQHHDIEPLPNGNILCLLKHSYTPAEIITEGRNPANIGAEFILDEIIELQPVGSNNATIVWEWKFIDHLIQDYDNSKQNFGVVVDHPELIDINFIDPSIANHNTDFTHVNGIDYNSSLDQIILSTRHLSELHIIDHSTTTSESENHSGGNSNQGGDFLWRWGNPQVYQQGTIANQKIFLQHDSKWVESGYIDEGKISVFNNGGDGSFSFSSVHLVTPEINSGVYVKENNTYKPTNFEWSWQGSILGDLVQEGKKSGAHSLPNGNFIICETSLGRISEIKKDGTLIWSYKNPTGAGNNIYNQFTTSTNDNSLFRGEKYPNSYIGFLGKDLTPSGIIENQNSNSNSCINLLDINEIELNTILVQNPIQENRIQFNKIANLDSVTIIDINGRIVSEFFNVQNNHISTTLEASIYILKLQKGNSIKHLKIIKY